MVNSNQIYDRVTNKIIELLKSHKSLNFSKSWFSAGQYAKNAMSGKFYNGINQIILSFAAEQRNFKLNSWLTFNQIKKTGGKLIKGSRSEPVTFWKFLYFDQNGNNITEKVEDAKKLNLPFDFEKRVPVLRYFNVFNVEQTKGLPEKYYKIPKPEKTVKNEDRDKFADDIIKNTGADIIHEVQDRAYYSPSLDFIKLPETTQFKTLEDLYKVTFHELGHWTGHKKRLNRDLSGAFGTPAYAKEELIAELCAAFVCQVTGYNKNIENNAAYIDSWLNALQNDNKFIFSAASKAKKAADYILSFSDLKAENYFALNENEKLK